MFVCLCVYMSVCLSVFLPACINVRMYARIYMYICMYVSKNIWTDFLSIPLKGAIFMNFHCLWGAYPFFFSTCFAFNFKLVSHRDQNLATKRCQIHVAAFFGSIHNGNSFPDISIGPTRSTQMLCDGIWGDFMASQEFFLYRFWRLSKAISGSDRQE